MKSTGTLRSYCRPCKTARSAEYRKLNPEKVKKWSKDFHTRHPEARKIKKLRKFGLTLEDYDQMVFDQLACCASCMEPTKVLHLDHNHKTGQPRELLCISCNVLAGWVESQPRRLRQVITYLQRHRAH
jgi:hypothetical protein